MRMLLRQFWRDIYGKEVQSAATYSYLWVADQMGHICIGIILDFVLTVVAFQAAYYYYSHFLERDVTRHTWGNLNQWPWLLSAALAASVAVSLWEYSAYKTDVRNAGKSFTLDRYLLRRNAMAAAFYMILGVVIGLAFHFTSVGQALPTTLAAVVIGILAAPYWLRQKILWQKAGLPFLFRLADLEASVLRHAVEAIEKLVASAAPPGAVPRQIVIAGPLNSGRTKLASGIGTEFAFKGKGVRYINMSLLLELAATLALRDSSGTVLDDLGPKNVEYWPWARAQVLIIDDVGPAAISASGHSDHTRFQQLLTGLLYSVAPALAVRHTVWILGDLGHGSEAEAELGKYAESITEFCCGKLEPLTVLLSVSGTPAVHGEEAAKIPAPCL
jgi:hypothetical protein